MTHHGRPSIKFRRPIFFGPEFREFRTFQRVDPEFFFNFFQSTRGESSFFPECCTPYWPQKKRNFSFFGFRMATRSRLISDIVFTGTHGIKSTPLSLACLYAAVAGDSCRSSAQFVLLHPLQRCHNGSSFNASLWGFVFGA